MVFNFNKLIVICLALFVFSCKKSSVEDLKDAQYCLNTATASNARNCLSKITSDMSPQAYELRCAAEFIAENKDISSLLTALNSVQGASQTAVAIQSLKFSSVTVSNNAFNYCNYSGIEVYAQLGSIFNISTIAASTSGADILTQINNIDDTTLGNIVLTTYQVACPTTTSSSNSNNSSTAGTQQYCKEIQNAVAANASNPAAIGACMTYLLTKQGAQPSGCVVPP